ncbi:MAG: hypothetical protein HXY25_11400 [Alphaproteobacteria bacterium]|nr:hypothetical protein [Alphaproteobacteria bacterium]
MKRLGADIVFLHSEDLPEAHPSYRYSMLLPAQALGARVVRVPSEPDVEAFLAGLEPEGIVVAKPVTNDRAVTVAEAARARGLPVLSWTCDLPVNEAAAFRQRRLLAASDTVIVQTAAMADSLAGTLRAPVEVIEECLEFPPGTVQFAPPEAATRLLWYGGISNFDTLGPMVHQLAGLTRRRLALCLVCAVPPRDLLALRDAGRWPQHIALRVLPYSAGNQLRALEDCDIVLVPSSDEPSKQLKGHNRVSTALNAGRAVIAHPLPPYRELGAYITLATDMAEGMEALLADPAAALARTRQGQAAVIARFGPEAVAAKWRAVIGATLARRG